MTRLRKVGLAGLFAASLTSITAAAAPVTSLSVLTYNVEGLPWPVRWGRTASFQHMSASLAALRSQGRQPHIVVFQEAFTLAAKRIAFDAGYAYAADGPGVADLNVASARIVDRAFVTGASAFRGEREGKWLDSGLRIASDYPIVSVRRMAFPEYACAGFDCLANKGVLAVTVAVPGLASPVVVVATHLNSSLAAGVDRARSLCAYRRQVDAVGDFVRRSVPSDLPLVFAGDFNAGKRLERLSYLVRSVANWRPGRAISVALESCLADKSCKLGTPADIRFSQRRGKDWQFYAPGHFAAIKVAALSVPFGHDPLGAMLSDHIGYVAHYQLTLIGLAARSTAAL